MLFQQYCLDIISAWLDRIYFIAGGNVDETGVSSKIGHLWSAANIALGDHYQESDIVCLSDEFVVFRLSRSVPRVGGHGACLTCTDANPHGVVVYAGNGKKAVIVAPDSAAHGGVKIG